MSAPTGSHWLGRRYLFSSGRLRLPSYGTLLYVGLVAGMYAGAALGRSLGLPPERFVLAVTVLLVPALVGSRLWYVLQYLDRFLAEPRRVWRREEGGLALYGGLVLAVLVALPVLRLADLPFWSFWDAATITMLVGLIFTRVGCLINGCCVGRATAGPLGMWLPDHRGQWLRRYPSQLLEAAWGGVVLLGVLAFRAALPFPGALFAASAGAYAAGRLLLEPLRATAHPRRTLWVNLAFSAALLAGAAAVFLVVRAG